MKLILEQGEAVFNLPKAGTLLIGNDDDCLVQINRPDIWGRHAAIKATSYGYVLEVASSPIAVNDITINSSCLLYSGDKISVSDLQMVLVDESYIPKTVNQNHEFNDASGVEEVSSVFGLRRLSGEENGAFIKSDYRHEDGWCIYRTDAKLALISNACEVFVNGKQVDSAWLENGDRIHYQQERFNVECPGHSGYSKFSPSHPRNVLLSESVTELETEKPRKQALRPHYWWLTLLFGLLVLIWVILAL